jgi:hypothetical protein
MSHPLVMALFPDRPSAEAAAREVHGLGIRHEDLSVVASNHQLEGMIADDVDASPGSEIEDSRAAGRVGEIIGSVLGAIAVAVPGTGAIVAAGPLAAELGEAAGHVAGHLSSILEKAGLSDEEAADWQRRIHAGAVLVGVHVRSVNAGQIEAIFASHGITRVVATDWKDY